MGYVLVLAVHAMVRTRAVRSEVALVLTATPVALRRPFLVSLAVALRPSSAILQEVANKVCHNKRNRDHRQCERAPIVPTTFASAPIFERPKYKTIN